MADNVTILDASGNPIVMRAKAISGVDTQVMQLDQGGSGAESLVSSSNPLNVQYPTLFGSGNPGQVAPQTGYLEIVGTGAGSGSTTLVASTDCIAYRTISIHITANSSTDTITWEVSNDNTNWVGFCLVKSSDTSAALVANAGTSTGIWSGPLPGRYLKIIRNATASTIALTVELRQ